MDGTIRSYIQLLTALVGVMSRSAPFYLSLNDVYFMLTNYASDDVQLSPNKKNALRSPSVSILRSSLKTYLFKRHFTSLFILKRFGTFV